MSRASSQNGQVIREFIQIYRKNEFLWKKGLKYHRNSADKQKAYKELQKKLAEVNKNATEDTVRIRIHSIRKSFFKELKKVENSIKNNDNNIYESKLWYFNEIAFIAEREIPKAKENPAKLSDIRYCSSTFIKEFISIYKKNECLWNTNIPEYKNNKIKLKSYEELRQKLLKVDKNATIETVKKRICSLRTNFKYNYFQLGKIGRSDLEKPESHYIYDLVFLKDHFADQKLIAEQESSSGKCDSPKEYKVFENIDTEDYCMQQPDNDVLWLALDEVSIKEETCDDNEIQVINQPIIDHPTLNIIDQPDLDLIDQPNLDLIDLTDSALDDQPGVELITQPSLDLIDLTDSDLADQPRLDLIIDQPRTGLFDQPVSDLNDQPLSEDIEKSLSEFKIKKDKPEENKEECVVIDDDEGDSYGKKRARTKTINNINSDSKPKRRTPKKAANIKEHKEPISEPIHEDDECDTYAKFVANEMRSLSSDDRSFLQNIFNKAFIEARLGKVKKLKLTRERYKKYNF